MQEHRNIDQQRDFLRISEFLRMLLLTKHIYLRAKSCNTVTTAAAWKWSSSFEYCWSDSDSDFRNDGRALQHMGPETMKTREPCDSSCSWEVHIALRCCPQMTTGYGRWERFAVMTGIPGPTDVDKKIQQAKFIDNADTDRIRIRIRIA